MTKYSRFVLVAVLVALTAGVVSAQMTPDTKIMLFENGQPVGEVFVPERATNAAYTEHWVLYPNYQYPGPMFVGELLVAPIPSQLPRTSVEELFRAAPLGSKHVRVDVQEFDLMPGR